MQLHSSRIDVPIALGTALAAAGPVLGERPTVILSAPRSCRSATLVEGRLVSPPGVKDIDLAVVYECRAFGSVAELRWLHERAGLGAAVVVSEDEAALGQLPGGWNRLDVIDAIDRIDQTALIWGAVGPAEPATAGWATASERRVADIALPVDIQAMAQSESPRAVVCSRAYIEIVDDHGNARITEERLTGVRAETAQDRQRLREEQT